MGVGRNFPKRVEKEGLPPLKIELIGRDRRF
jgi:hypothetical protein